MIKPRRGPALRMRIFKAAALFLATLWLADWQDWQARDIAWSMWAASLTVGYALILLSLYAPRAASPSSPLPVSQTAAAVTVASRLFNLVFLTVHFSLFHAVHAAFLQILFPMPSIAAGEAFTLNLFLFLSAAFSAYWLFVVLAFLARADLLIAAVRGRQKISILTPYAAVIKNHLVILALGILTAAAPTASFLWLLLFAYFFPWSEAGMLIGRLIAWALVAPKTGRKR